MTPNLTVLVTGGAGYIGGHAVLALLDAEYKVVVLDDLSTGRRDAVPHDVAFVQADIGQAGIVAEVIEDHHVRAVMHFAASVVAPISVNQPLSYYRNNTLNSLILIESCVRAGIQQFIFSSTAAVYGEPETTTPVAEDAPTRPINPYGTSKLMTEWILRDAAAAHGMRYAILRYFNAAGADPRGRLGNAKPIATDLITVACQAALGLRSEIPIYGDDYPTPDGTCIRDYIHVTDLADAHVRALRHLQAGGESLILNCGYSHGYSVKQVLHAVEEVCQRSLQVRRAGRRSGDAPNVTAAVDRLRSRLGWLPRHDDLYFIIKTALEWERRLPPTIRGSQHEIGRM